MEKNIEHAVEHNGSDKSVWPGAFGVYKTSKAAVMVNIWPILYVLLASMLLSIAVGAFFTETQTTIITFIPASLLSAALTILYIQGARGKKMEFEASVRAAWPLLATFIVVNLLSGLAILAGILLLIVPGLVLLARLSLAPYFAVDKKLGAVDSLKASMQATKGNAGKVWGIIGATFAMALLIVTIIGIPFAIYFLFMYQAATVILYEHLRKA
jgi:uncharacterized membrane protein